jgi:signal peptidase
MHHQAADIQDPRVALTVESVARFGRARIRVTGSSMLPAIWPGDAIEVERRALGEVCVGDVALFVRGARLFAHRIVEHRVDEIVTQGDTVPNADAPVNGSSLVGIVARVEHRGRVVSIGRQTFSQRIVAGCVRR